MTADEALLASARDAVEKAWHAVILRRAGTTEERRKLCRAWLNAVEVELDAFIEEWRDE